MLPPLCFTIACFVVVDKMKDAVIAKVAAQTEDYYADAMKMMQRETIRSCFEKVRATIDSSVLLSCRAKNWPVQCVIGYNYKMYL